MIRSFLERPSSCAGVSLPEISSLSTSASCVSSSTSPSPRSSSHPPYLLPRFSPSSLRDLIWPSNTKAPTPRTLFSEDVTSPHTSSCVSRNCSISFAKIAILFWPESFSFSLATLRAFSNSTFKRSTSFSAAFLRLADSPTSSSSHSFRRAVASLISLEALLAPLKSRFEAAAFFSASNAGILETNIACSDSNFEMAVEAALSTTLASLAAASHFTTSA